MVTAPAHDAAAIAEIAKGLTADDTELLNALYVDHWMRPMDCGGTDSSDHSRRLTKLARKGLVERCRRNSIANDCRGRRGSYVYRLTPLGLAVRARISQAKGE